MKKWISAEKCTSFHHQVDFTQIIVKFLVEKSGKVVTAAFYLYGGSLWKKKRSSRKKQVFLKRVSDLERKRISILTILFLHCSQNCILSPWNYFLTFCQQLILGILFDIWARICWIFGVKILAALPKLHSNLQKISSKRNQLIEKT